jgi:lipoprotein-anchoring transpeptidase ErfK/SrfK
LLHKLYNTIRTANSLRFGAKKPPPPANPFAAAKHFNIFYQVNLIHALHGEALLSPLETGMRRLATLCFPAFLFAAPAPSMAANDGVIVFVPPETQLSQYASGAAPASLPAPAPTRGRYGGGLIEALLTGGALRQPQMATPIATEQAEVETEPEPQFRRQEVDYTGREAPGTIVVDTPDRFLFLVEPHGKALRYGIGVGRPGFEWSGVKRISRKSEWPDWAPPAQMMLRRPDLPRHMAGGPDNPLGARALYLGSSLYRIHGTNEPSTIGHNVSSGCIRMMNEDVIDLYDRVPIGTTVVVL